MMEKIMKKIIYLTLALFVVCVMIMACNDGSKDSVTIEFDTDGGSEVDSVDLDIGGKLPSDYFRTGSMVPVKEGYRFKGWAIITDEEDTDEPDEPEEGEEAGETTETPEIKEITIISTAKTFWEDTTLTAQWARRITVNFDLGKDVSGTPPDPVEIDEGSRLGSKYPPIPSRTGYEFDVWENSTGTNQYTVKTPIVTDDAVITLFARWEKEYVPENAQSPAIHPGNHFSETGGLTREVRVGESFIVAGLFSNIEKGQGVLSSKWYRTTSEDEANAATAAAPKGNVVLEQKAPDANPYELSLPFTWSEPAAGTYWYYVVVTNYNEKATKQKYSSAITQNKLKVTVTK